ncbi:DUF1638 domain-containing protein [Sedimentisphaera salicampi]|uniref:DUF1638 domain-containing protein n=1 Tax=Sedimentisphaera salicampi TaxID=1941349 RepID=UPI000B9B5705|nr:DUF1638 domain-containing protein [Sedimentisphaera salicampi]OXU15420.1 hypothetical protein SMSP1_00901 [Sedimentisphaera salicampi]
MMPELLPDKCPLEGQKRLKLVCCEALRREAYLCAARSRNIVDIQFLRRSLHDTPEMLNETLAKALAGTKDSEGNEYDAILLGYGLCSNSVLGIKADVPLVITRAHDCAAILLGSRHRYQQLFDSEKGIFWYSPGWIETCLMPGQDKHEKMRQEYAEKYGEDNADYLMEMEQSWIQEYSKAFFVKWPEFETLEFEEYTKKCAEYLGWEYRKIEGSSELMQKMFDGKWDREDFLVVPSGEVIHESVCDDKIMGCG